MKSPKEIYAALEQHVVGQTYAKKVLSTAVYDHCIRCAHPETSVEKSNILLIGPTGVGKTLLAKTLSRVMNLPIAIADATALTQAGYVGEDIENCLLRLIQAANGDIERAQKGILFIDEIDKIGRRSESASITRDVSGEGVQQGLLKMLEGSVVNVPASGGRKRPDGVGYIPIDTSNILFICSGAFEGLDYDEDITTSDLKHFGMLPELLGRLPIIAQLEPLSSDDLVHILTVPEHSIVNQFKDLFKLSGCTLEFEASALQYIASYAIQKHIGARGLRSVIERCLLDVKFHLPGISKYTVTLEEVQGKLQEL